MTVPLTLVVEIEQHVRTFHADAEADDLVSTGPAAASCAATSYRGC